MNYVDSIKSKKFSPQDILRACPFDHQRNLNKLLTEDIFFDLMFYEDAVYASHLDAILSAFWGDSTEPQVIVLHGHSGTGKSTFLRHTRRTCIRKQRDVEFKIIDFHALPQPDQYKEAPALTTGNEPELHSHRNEEHEDTAEPPAGKIAELARQQEYLVPPSPIANALRTVLIDFSFERTKETIVHMRANRRSFNTLISRYGSALLRDSELNDDDGYLDLLNRFNYNDILMLFFVRMFRKMEEGQRIVVCFDNLDVLGTEYISAQFLRGFDHAMNALSLLSQRSEIFDGKSIDFRRQIRFLFVLRDANKALANRHIVDSVGSDEVIDFFEVYSSLDIPKIYSRRIDAIRLLCSQREIGKNNITLDELLSLLKGYIDSRYFSMAIRPLFNHDLKKIVEILYGLTVKPIPDGVSRGALGDDYGIIGRFVYAISERLKDVSLFRDWYADKYATKEGGEIVEARILLTVLLNLCVSGRNARRNPARPFRFVSLFELLVELRETVADRKIFDILSSAYLSHDSIWVGLLAFQDKKLLSRDDFATEERILKEARKRIETEGLTGLNDEALSDLLAPLRQIMLRPNSAAYALTRHIIIHFEFVSCMFSFYFDNAEPLFGLGASKDCNGRYRFIAHIDSMYRVVESQKAMMEKFCQSWFFDELGLDPVSFCESVFCFRIADEAREPTGQHLVRQTSGQHHPVRVICQNIDYIDRFRLNLITSGSRFSKSEDQLTEEGREINTLLCGSLRRYCELLRGSIDPSSGGLCGDFSGKLTSIEVSDYMDHETRVRSDHEKRPL